MRRQVVRPAQLERGPGRQLVLEARHGEGRHVLERDPADRVLAGAVDRHLPLGVIEAERGSEPRLHEHRGAEHRGPGDPRSGQVTLHAPLGAGQRVVAREVAAVRDEDEGFRPRPGGRVHQVLLAVPVDGGERVVGPARAGRGGAGDHRLHAAARLPQRARILEVRLHDPDPHVAERGHPVGARGGADQAPDLPAVHPEPPADLSAQVPRRSRHQNHSAVLQGEIVTVRFIPPPLIPPRLLPPRHLPALPLPPRHRGRPAAAAAPSAVRAGAGA